MEIRLNDNILHIEGYVNVTEKKSRLITENGKTFREIVKPTVFQRAISKADNVEFLLNHDPNLKLGDIKSGVKLYEDSIGLKIEANITDENAIRSYNDNGKFNGFSFGFIANKDNFTVEDGVNIRKLEDIDLIEVSLLEVGYTPAYYGTLVLNAERRSINDKPIEYRELIVENITEDNTTEDNNDNSNVDELENIREYFNLMKYYIENL